MRAELAAGIGFVIGAAGVLVATPVAIRVAIRTDCYDRPRGYRQHAAPTPFLGGTAVLAAFLLPAIAVGGTTKGYAVLLVCVLAMWAIGTLDDRVAVPPRWRLLAEVIAAAALSTAEIGWRVPGGDGVELVLTVIWVVGLVNAFNLMDNLDGACGTVGCVSSLGIGTLAAIHHQPIAAGMAFALAGACAGFLRWNLARPARVFLGDGGSMPVGFLVAGLGMLTSRGLHEGGASLLAIGLMAGVVVFDTSLVSVSRTRRGVPLVTGGRDHLTHRLLRRLGSPFSVAASLALVQVALCVLAIVGDQFGSAALVSFATGVACLGVLAIAVLDSERWRPAGIAVAQPSAPIPPITAPDLEPAGIEPL